MLKKVLIILLFLASVLLAQNFSKIELNDLSGNTFAFAENLNYDATIVTFWATWCLPCQKEHVALQELREKYGDRLLVIAISTDSPRSMAKVKSYARSRKYDFVFLVDPDREVASELLVNEIPQTFVLDRNGKVVYHHTGYRKGDEIELEEELLKVWQQEQK
ncbi:TlpA family protein disulfide reductase [Caldithrix abyssi]